MADFSVGVTGHRPNRLPAEIMPRVMRQLGEALQRLQAGRPAGECVLVTGMAEGTDQIAADIAFAAGWRVVAILPFSLERYLQDFETPVTKAALRTLLAKSAEVLEAPRADFYQDPNDGYYEQGIRMLDRVDAVVTVWNGAPANGRGGTAEIIERALAVKKPVLWISSVADVEIVALS